MYLSEWEIEDAIAWDPSIIEVSPFCGLRLKDRQRYLKTIGGYIDLLFEWQDKYVIAELKAIPIDDKSIITDQVLAYRRALAGESNITEDRIVCILATPGGFSEDVLESCKRYGIVAKNLDEHSLIRSAPRHHDSLLLGFPNNEEENRLLDLLQRRHINLRSSEIGEHTASAVKSAKTWLSQRIHDDFGKRGLADLFKRVSSQAPLMAHEVLSTSNGALRTNEEKWFWLFYSVLDRRANASTFVNARNALDRQGLFNPRHIVGLAEKIGEEKAKRQIAHILEDAGFALLVDNGHGKLAYPQSIIDAARLMNKYDYDFGNMYSSHLDKNHTDPYAAFVTLWTELTDEIYGVGPRIASQFIRGMALQGSWNLPLKDNRLLENTPLNCRFAGSPRFCLVESEATYERELGTFADEYLDGNRAIVSHVLWYVRKRYCGKVPNCSECPLTGYCALYLKLSKCSALRAKGLKLASEIDRHDRIQTTLAAFASEP